MSYSHMLLEETMNLSLNSLEVEAKSVLFNNSGIYFTKVKQLIFINDIVQTVLSI